MSLRHPRALPGMRRDDMVPLDHSIQSLSIDCEDARCCLLVSTSVFEHAGNIPTFDLRERDPIFNCRLIQRNLRIRTTLRRRKKVFRLQHRLLYYLNILITSNKRVAAFHKLYLLVGRSRASWVRMLEVASAICITNPKTLSGEATSPWSPSPFHARGVHPVLQRARRVEFNHCQ